MRIVCSLPVRLVLGRDVDDAVGVDVERDLDLRHAARRGRNADQVELAEQLVVAPPSRARPGARGSSPPVWLSSAVEKIWLFLVGIVVLRSISRVNTPPSVSMPSDSGVTSSSSTSFDVALQHAGLDGRADGHDFVGVDALVRLLAEEALHDLLHLGHARHAADQNHFVDLAWRSMPASLSACLHGSMVRCDRGRRRALELGARELHVEMLGAGLVGRDERQVDVGLHGRGELDLGLLRCFLEALQRHAVLAQIDALLFLNSSAR